MIDKELLDILVCPACGEGAVLAPDPAETALVCSRCDRRYPVREGIPVMLVEEAEIPDGRRVHDVLPQSGGATP